MSKATELAQQYLETVFMASFLLLTICSLVLPSSCIIIILKSDTQRTTGSLPSMDSSTVALKENPSHELPLNKMMVVTPLCRKKAFGLYSLKKLEQEVILELSGILCLKNTSL